MTSVSLSDGLLKLAQSEQNEYRIKMIEEAFMPFSEKLLKPDRALVGEGILTKVCKKKNKQRAFFLFNDILVYGKIVFHKAVKKYTGQQIISLVGMRVISLNDDLNLKFAFNFLSPKKSFTVLANSQKEKDDWLNHVEKCIMSCNGGKVPSAEDVSSTAPLWVNDKFALACMKCNKKFTVLNRRHHCRNCGIVVCGECSKNKFCFPNISDTPQRICDTCLLKLTTETDKPHEPNLPNASKVDETSESSDSDSPETPAIYRTPTFYSSVKSVE